MSKSGKILLHSCCAPCATASAEQLLKGGKDVTLFFSNSNIAPKAEYDKRLEELCRLAKRYDVPVIEDVYDHDLWLDKVKGMENEPERGERCRACFEFSMARAAKCADEKDFQSFATTLTISPMKRSDMLLQAGSIHERYYHHDFKKKNGFQRSAILTKEFALYRQDYCGCEFSINNRNYYKNENKT